MVLAKDIWTSIIEQVTGKVGEIESSRILLVIVITMSPFFAQKTLHSLRFNCYLGFTSVSILCFALCHHVFLSPIPEPLVLWTDSWDNVLFAFPIITLSFLSIFNVLPIQGSLIDPSRRRMSLVIDSAIGSSFIIMVLFGVCGYLYAGISTDGNILNNSLTSGDWLVFIGRLGCAITIMLAMALMLPPCREGLLEVIDITINGPHEVLVEEEIPLIGDKTGDLLLHKRERINDNIWIHYLITFGIDFSSYLIAIHVPGVAVVWSLCRSFMAFMIAFILPTACYIKIQKNNYPSPRHESIAWVWISWCLLVTSVIAAIACTIQTLIRLT
jgi:sodium-coupled neutral amino acid transporter 11